MARNEAKQMKFIKCNKYRESKKVIINLEDVFSIVNPRLDDDYKSIFYDVVLHSEKDKYLKTNDTDHCDYWIRCDISRYSYTQDGINHVDEAMATNPFQFIEENIINF